MKPNQSHAAPRHAPAALLLTVATAVLVALLVPVPPRAFSAQATGASAAPADARTAAYLEAIRDEPLLLRAFLQAMPKGGDLHNHPSGAAYAESLIAFAAGEGLCVLRATLVLAAPPCDPPAGAVPASAALTDQALYDALVDAWSVRAFVPTPGVSGHDQFFSTFARFGLATGDLGELQLGQHLVHQV